MQCLLKTCASHVVLADVIKIRNSSLLTTVDSRPTTATFLSETINRGFHIRGKVREHLESVPKLC